MFVFLKKYSFISTIATGHYVRTFPEQKYNYENSKINGNDDNSGSDIEKSNNGITNNNNNPNFDNNDTNSDNNCVQNAQNDDIKIFVDNGNNNNESNNENDIENDNKNYNKNNNNNNENENENNNHNENSNDKTIEMNVKNERNKKNDRVVLLKGLDITKDQSYFLSMTKVYIYVFFMCICMYVCKFV